MATVYTALLDPSTVQSLREAGFRIDTDDAGWIAEYSAGHHRVRVEATPAGWWVSHVRIAGSYERVKTNVLVDELADAARMAVDLAADLNRRLLLIGSVAGPILAELGWTS